MSYHRTSDREKWLIARRKGTSPITVTHLRFKTKEQAEKKARSLNKQTEGSDLKFLVRKKGWRRKRWWS